jgi:hypothetical protein
VALDGSNLAVKHFKNGDFNGKATELYPVSMKRKFYYKCLPIDCKYMLIIEG